MQFPLHSTFVFPVIKKEWIIGPPLDSKEQKKKLEAKGNMYMYHIAKFYNIHEQFNE